MQLEKRECWVWVEKTEVTWRNKNLSKFWKLSKQSLRGGRQMECWSTGVLWSVVLLCTLAGSQLWCPWDVYSPPVVLWLPEPLHWLSCLPVKNCGAVLHSGEGNWTGYGRPLWSTSAGRKGGYEPFLSPHESKGILPEWLWCTLCLGFFSLYDLSCRVTATVF